MAGDGGTVGRRHKAVVGMASKVARKPAWAASVHLCREIELKKPFWRYFEVYGEQGHAFFLDSAGGPEALAR